MYVYADESGAFVIPRREHRVSAIGALVVPESQHRSLIRAFNRLTDPWTPKGKELKGNRLNATQVAAVIELARRYDVLLEICATDMGLYGMHDIVAYQQGQADRLIEGINALQTPNQWRVYSELRATMLSLSPQLFVQSMLTIVLLIELLQTAIIFYVQRHPRELRRFRWRIDAKASDVTASEKLWTDLILPFAQARSLNEPLVTVEGANYRHFERFFVEREKAPTFLREHMEQVGRPGGINLTAIFQEDFAFRDSREEAGLRLTDVLVNAFCRAVNGNLEEQGWANLGTLMVRKPRGAVTTALLRNDPAPFVETVNSPYIRVFRTLHTSAREILQ